MDEINASRSIANKRQAGVLKSGAGSRLTLAARLQSAAYRIADTARGYVGTGRGKLRFAILSAALAIAISSFIAVFIYGMRFSYSVSYNGAKMGVVSSKSQVETVIANVEAKVSTALGYDYSFDGGVSGKLTVTDRSTALDSVALERSLLDAVPELGRFYAVSVGGEIVGGMDAGDEALETINDVLESCKSAGVIRAEFVQNVSVSYKYAPSEYLAGAEALKASLIEKIDSSELDVALTYLSEYSEPIPFQTEVVDDADMYYDCSKVLTEGSDGAVLRRVETTVIEGRESTHRLVENKLISNPVTEIIAVGTAEKPAYASTGSYSWPADGPITSYFGLRSVSVGSSMHKGIDIGAQYGAPITAADGGEVIYSGYMSGYGYLIQIRHDNGDVTYYAHCSRLTANEGDHVTQGDLIAYVGNTGVSSGAHLHFEIRVNGVAVDPLTALS